MEADLIAPSSSTRTRPPSQRRGGPCPPSPGRWRTGASPPSRLEPVLAPRLGRRTTVALLMPRLRHSSLDDQCVTPSDCGGGSRVAAMITASSRVLGGLDRSSSGTRPTRREQTVPPRDHPRARHLDPLSPSAWATASTIRARFARLAGCVRILTQEASSERYVGSG
jgi:hypothetical protein